MTETEFLRVTEAVDRLLSSDKERILVAIDGMCGSGKSTLADALLNQYDCTIYHMDDFYLQPYQRTKERYLEPGGNVDRERFQTEVLTPLRSGKTLTYRRFLCSSMSLEPLEDATMITPGRLSIIEGSYSEHPVFGDVYDLRLFLSVSEKTQIERIARRNGETMLKRFIDEWIPYENRYFEAFAIREKAMAVSGE